MLDVFSVIFLADTKIIFRYDFVAPLKLTLSKLQFPKFKKFISRSVFWELQLAQISLNFKTACWNLKIISLGAKLCVAFQLF